MRNSKNYRLAGFALSLCMAFGAAQADRGFAHNGRTAANPQREIVSRTVPAYETLVPRIDSEMSMQVYLTGYSFWDNTPPGSAEIARPVVHRGAGGTGTFADPVTLAVGHSISGARHSMDFPAGTRFYIERLRKYAIVEDLCGDGNRPQNGPCHIGRNGMPWIDIYVGGQHSGPGPSQTCMYRITGVQRVIVNPRPGRPVEAGELTASGCRTF